MVSCFGVREKGDRASREPRAGDLGANAAFDVGDHVFEHVVGLWGGREGGRKGKGGKEDDKRHGIGGLRAGEVEWRNANRAAGATKPSQQKRTSLPLMPYVKACSKRFRSNHDAFRSLTVGKSTVEPRWTGGFTKQ